MHAHAVDEVEEHLFERRSLALQVRQRDAGRRGERAELGGVGAAHGEAGAQRLVGDARGIQRRTERRAVGRVDDGGVVALLREPGHVTLVDEAAVGDDQQRRHRLLHLGEHVRGDEHRAPLAGELAQKTPQPLDALGVETVRGLVEHEHARVAEQRVRQAQALAHAEREPADLAARDVGESDESEHLVDPAGRQPRGLRVHLQVVRGGAPGVEAGCLERRPDRLQRPREVGVAAAGDRRGARGGRHEAEQDAQARRLSGAVGAEESGDRSGFDAGGESVDGGDGSEALRHVGELEDMSFGHGGASRRRGR